MSRADLTVRRRAHPHDILFCFFTIFGFRLAVARVSCRAFPSLSSPPPPASLHIHPSTRTQHTTTHAYTHIHQITLGFPLVLYDITHGFFRAKGKPTRTRGGGFRTRGFLRLNERSTICFIRRGLGLSTKKTRREDLDPHPALCFFFFYARPPTNTIIIITTCITLDETIRETIRYEKGNGVYVCSFLEKQKSGMK
jgi:hypothetical protein